MKKQGIHQVCKVNFTHWLTVNETNVGLSISQWLPCPLAILVFALERLYLSEKPRIINTGQFHWDVSAHNEFGPWAEPTNIMIGEP